MTRVERARAGEITLEMKLVAEKEGVTAELVRQGVAQGTIVILGDSRRGEVSPVGIGAGLRIKVSASVGTSPDQPDPAVEVAKVTAAVGAGADTVMDLSLAGDLDGARRATLAASPVPLGTLPLYQAMAEARRDYGSALEMAVDGLFAVLERQLADGVSFVALHCGVTRQVVERARRTSRSDYLVSRGGSHLIAWMLHHDQENPLYEHFDRILELASRYDAVLCLDECFRPGYVGDSLDAAQVQEMVILGELLARSRRQGVPVMVKGPGQVPLNQLRATVQLAKRLGQGAPYFVYGPAVTGVAPGYDHIAAAIGAAISAWAGADFLCYVTPGERLGTPNLAEVREGVTAVRIAAHAAEIARGSAGARQWDLAMSRARRDLNWEGQVALALDPEGASTVRRERNSGPTATCAMCGRYCAMQLVVEYLGGEVEAC